MEQKRPIQIFLAHSSGDKPAVLELYERLKAEGYNPWVDRKKLLPGQNWREVIPKALKESDMVIACLSKQSTTTKGYVNEELRLALKEYVQRPPEGIYLIPLKLEPCEIPNMELPQVGVSLRDFHWLDYWEADGFELLVKSIEYQRESIEEGGEPSKSVTQETMPSPSAPELKLAPVTVLTKGKKATVESPSELPYKTFSFEVIRVDATGKEVDRKEGSAEYVTEDLGNGLTLDLAAIPGGSFLMGSPDNEAKRRKTESPQHQVSVPPFLLGKYPVTQAQWEAVMGNNPSSFKGKDRPVERVSWNDAQEFCQKLSQKTGKDYRLPSEAEWEYACRAGTETPFYFGETITTDLVNFNGVSTYGSGPKGQYRVQTTEVSIFPPNAFGLYDMHGNVWEWCQDQWHGSYKGAPIDGSAWISENDNYSRIIRGGCWYSGPRFCRSASRRPSYPGYRLDYVGFRVVLAPR